jgi:hypothetical protein
VAHLLDKGVVVDLYRHEWVTICMFARGIVYVLILLGRKEMKRSRSLLHHILAMHPRFVPTRTNARPLARITNQKPRHDVPLGSQTHKLHATRLCQHLRIYCRSRSSPLPTHDTRDPSSACVFHINISGGSIEHERWVERQCVERARIARCRAPMRPFRGCGTCRA